jgi:hypothetical protein
LRDLERVARLLKEQLETETAKYQEALARERVKATPADARIIQRALAPQLPSFPKKLPILAFATLASLILSIGVVLAGELLTGRAQALPESAGSQGDIGVGGEPPAPTPAHAPPRAGASMGESQASVLQQIERERSARNCVKVLVAPCGKEGKSADIAIGLARNLSRRGRALLAIPDRGRSAFDALTHSGHGAPKGFADIVAGVADFAEAIHRDVGSRLHVMPGGVSEGPQAHDFDLVLTALTHAYDFLIFAASKQEALRLAPHMDLAFVLGDDADAETLRAEIEQAGVDAHLLEGASASDDLAAA